MNKKRIVKVLVSVLATNILLNITNAIPIPLLTDENTVLATNAVLNKYGNCSNNDNSKNSNIEINGIDDIPEEYTTEIKEPGKTIITKISSTRSSIKLKWKKAKKCQGYIISRSTKKHYGYKEIVTIKNSKKISYTDKNLIKNKKYYYYIKAYNSKGDITVYGKYSKVTGIKTKK